MRAVDTNVLVRLIVRDDAKQLAAAERFIASGAWVPLLALAEAIWVLDAVYGRGPAQIATGIEMLLHHQHLSVQNSDAARAALETFRAKPALGYSDCLLVELARKAGHLPVGTFDRGLARVPGTEKL